MTRPSAEATRDPMIFKRSVLMRPLRTRMAVPPWLLPQTPAGAHIHSRPWPAPADCSRDAARASTSLHRALCSCRNQRSSSCSSFPSPVPPMMPATCVAARRLVARRSLARQRTLARWLSTISGLARAAGVGAAAVAAVAAATGGEATAKVAAASLADAAAATQVLEGTAAAAAAAAVVQAAAAAAAASEGAVAAAAAALSVYGDATGQRIHPQ
eukprot:212189-Chlamydomonas_euryale.AAC.1